MAESPSSPFPPIPPRPGGPAGAQPWNPAAGFTPPPGATAPPGVFAPPSPGADSYRPPNFDRAQPFQAPPSWKKVGGVGTCGKIAGGIMVVLGIIGLLATAAIMMLATSVDRQTDSSGAAGLFLIIALCAIGLYMALGIALLRGRTWARTVALVLYGIGLVLSLMSASAGRGGGLGLGLVVFILLAVDAAQNRS